MFQLKSDHESTITLSTSLLNTRLMPGAKGILNLFAVRLLDVMPYQRGLFLDFVGFPTKDSFMVRFGTCHYPSNLSLLRYRV